jgi:hypothetical protein
MVDFQSSHVGSINDFGMVLFPPPAFRERRHRDLLAASAALDWLDVVHSAPIPIRAEPTATRCGETGAPTARRFDVCQALEGPGRGDSAVFAHIMSPLMRLEITAIAAV